MFEFSGKEGSAKSDNGTLTVNGNNSFAGGTTVNDRRLPGVSRVEEPGQIINSGTLTTDDGISAGDKIAMNYSQSSDVATPLQQLQRTALQSREQAQITPAGIVQITNAVVLYRFAGITNRDTFYNGVTRDDANGLRALLQTNAVAFNDSEQQKPQEMSARQRLYAQKENAEPNAASATPLNPPIQLAAADEDKSLPKTQLPPPIPQPEVLCRENNFSTFSLNVSDVSFKLAAASLEKGRMPDAASIRSEEFINAFDYRDPEAAAGQPLAFAVERARYPFAHNRDLLRFSVKTAAAGRPAGRALNLVLLLDNSGSMERADRVAIIREALRVLAAQLQPQDTVSVVTFARTARLWADGVPGDKAGETLKNVGGITPDGGTNLEEAMRLAYETARRHYLANGMNRVVLLTDGAANLGNVSPSALKEKVEAQRKQGIALDCFGIGFEDFNDDLLEQLSSNGDGRYAFLNSPEDASKEFAAKLAGALQVAAQDVKVQVEFNPQRVISWRQIGYAKHQLTKEQFRDNTVDAAEIAAQEAGNALYTVETKPDGIGPIATVRVRYKVPGTTDYRERSWNVDYAAAPALEQSSAAMRLAATASAFSEWLAASPFAQEVTLDELQKILNGVPQVYGADQRPAKLETMIREAKSVSGK
jgi:autotransporter-associated beta strand protein